LFTTILSKHEIVFAINIELSGQITLRPVPRTMASYSSSMIRTEVGKCQIEMVSAADDSELFSVTHQQLCG